MRPSRNGGARLLLLPGAWRGLHPDRGTMCMCHGASTHTPVPQPRRPLSLGPHPAGGAHMVGKGSMLTSSPPSPPHLPHLPHSSPPSPPSPPSHFHLPHLPHLPHLLTSTPPLLTSPSPHLFLSSSPHIFTSSLPTSSFSFLHSSSLQARMEPLLSWVLGVNHQYSHHGLYGACRVRFEVRFSE